MPKRIISVFGGFEMGKTLFAGQLTGYLPNAVWYKTHDENNPRLAGAEGTFEQIQRVYAAIGSSAMADTLVIDEDPVDTALMRVVGAGEPYESVVVAHETFSYQAALALGVPGSDIRRSYLHVTMPNETMHDRIAAHTHAIHADRLPIAPVDGSLEFDALRAAGMYEDFLRNQGASVVSLDRTQPYDLGAVAHELLQS